MSCTLIVSLLIGVIAPDVMSLWISLLNACCLMVVFSNYRYKPTAPRVANLCLQISKVSSIRTPVLPGRLERTETNLVHLNCR